MKPIELPTPRKRAIIYCRVSTDKQEEEGESLEYQEAQCRRYAEQHQMDVVLVLHEVKSGRIHYRFREKLTLARQMIRDKVADVIIVWDLRRFSRSFYHSTLIFAEIHEHGGTVISVYERVDDTPVGQLVRMLMMWNAESEHEKIMEYANRHWKTRVELGLPVGSGYPPYGWQWGDEEKTYYVINPKEAIVRYAIFHMFVEQEMSLRAIVHKLTEDNVPTPTSLRQPNSKHGKHWNHTTVYDYLRDPINIGTLIICKRSRSLDEQGRLKYSPHPQHKVIENAIPPIVPIELYERAQRKLATNQVEQSHPPKDPTKHLLRGHICCATCGYRMSMRIVHRRQYEWPIYYCANRRNKHVKCPDIPVIRADWLDPIVWAECCRLFERIEAIQARLEQELERSVNELLEDTKGPEHILKLRALIDRARQERAKHQEGDYLYDLITEDIQQKTEQLARFEADYASSRDTSKTQAAYRERILSFWEFMTVMRGKYGKATFQEKRNALDVLGVMVKYRPRTAEERRRGKDATVDELRQRMSITYSPIFAGVGSSGEGRPQNQ